MCCILVCSNQSDEDTSSRRPFLCLDAVYATILLWKGYGFPGSQMIRVMYSTFPCIPQVHIVIKRMTYYILLIIVSCQYYYLLTGLFSKIFKLVAC